MSPDSNSSQMTAVRDFLKSSSYSPSGMVRNSTQSCLPLPGRSSFRTIKPSFFGSELGYFSLYLLSSTAFQFSLTSRPSDCTTWTAFLRVSAMLAFSLSRFGPRKRSLNLPALMWEMSASWHCLISSGSESLWRIFRASSSTDAYWQLKFPTVKTMWQSQQVRPLGLDNLPCSHGQHGFRADRHSLPRMIGFNSLEPWYMAACARTRACALLQSAHMHMVDEQSQSFKKLCRNAGHSLVQGPHGLRGTLWHVEGGTWVGGCGLVGWSVGRLVGGSAGR